MKSFFKAAIAVVFLSASLSASANNLIAETTELTLDGAKFIASHAAKKAAAEKWNVIIAITDASGNLKYLERMDNVQLSSLDTAIEKAKTAALYKRSTKVFQDRVQKGEIPLMALSSMTPFAGGLPIIVDGNLIGAVGVSGVKGDEDAQIAQAGIAEFLKQLSQ